jgi:alpha-tubulin suppressor-like RCC1 family protein
MHFQGKLIKMVACGDDHSVFLTRDYELKACGHGSNGQLGVGY